MKDEPRSPSPVRHQLNHAVPTVIHNPEEDLPLLARWLNRAMANQTRFWSLVAGLVAVVILLAILANGVSLGRAASDEAWTKLETADTPAKRVEVAEDFPNTLAARWALLQAASEFYTKGFADLPSNRDAALPNLKKALDLYERVERESPQDSPQARVAAFGAARALEARNQLDKAIDQYKKVAKTWPGTVEAEQSEAQARELAKPESAAFYKELYAYKPTEFSLPPLGDLKLPANHPPVGGLPAGFPKLPAGLLPPPPPTPAAKTEAPAAAPAPASGAAEPLPADPFAPAPPKGETPKK